MKNSKRQKLECSDCCNYELNNRSFGHCKKLNVSVRGKWKACYFYRAPFHKIYNISI